MNTSWTARGEIDLEIHGPIAELQQGIPLLILFYYFGNQYLEKFINSSTLYTKLASGFPGMVLKKQTGSQ